MIGRPAGRDCSHVLIGNLGLANSLRILSTGRLRRAGAIHCKRATGIARWYWGRRIVEIPDHTYTAVGDGYFVSVLNDRLLDLVDGVFDEADRYVKRYFELRMTADLNGSAGLILDYEILKPSLDGHVSILVPDSPFVGALRRRYVSEALDIDSYFTVSGIRQAILTIGIVGVNILRAAVRSVLIVRAKPGGIRTRPTVSVSCYRGGKSTGLRSDLFWLEKGRHYPNVIAEQPTALYPFTDQMVTELGERGIMVVETHGRKRSCRQSRYWLPGPVFLKGFLGSVPSLARGFANDRRTTLNMRLWKVVCVLRFNLFLHQRLDYYRAFDVKCEMSMARGSYETAHSSALAQLGGITVTHQYTVSFFFGVATSTSTVHLYFGQLFGENGSPLLSDFSLVSGYVFKGSVLAADDITDELKSQLLRVGVRRSVSFFEENPAWKFKERFIFPVYAYLMEKVLAEPGFGVLIKPKKDSTVGVLTSVMGPLFDQALRTGRFIVLNWYYYPGVVARAVDLSTGIMGTSTLESAVLGRPTLHLNSRGAPHPFFHGAEKNTFETVDEFTAAIDMFFRDSANSDIGRHSDDFLKSVDHDGDGRAGERMAHIALTFVSQIEKGAGRSEAFEHTMDDYDTRWGLCHLRTSLPPEDTK